MKGLLKAVQSVLLAMIILAILGTAAIIFFNKKADSARETETAAAETETSSVDLGENNFPSGIVGDTSGGTISGDSVSDNTASSVTPAEHKHSYQPSVLKQATCTEVGQMKYTCSCGDFYIDSIAALEHKPGEWKVVKKATKRATGLKQQRCTRCNTILKEEVLPKTTVSGNGVSGNGVSGNGISGNDPDHRHNFKSAVTKKETCLENGEMTYTCFCGSSYKISIPATYHPSRQTVVTEATCSAPGTVICSCAICKTVISQDTLPSTGHSFSAWTVTKQATKTEDGSRSRTCSKCGTKETETIPKVTDSDISSGAHKHNYVPTITKQATCTEDGVLTYNCSCSDSYTEAIAKLSHNPGNWVTVSAPTAETPGLKEQYCRRCGEKLASEDIPYVAEHVHDYKYKITKAATCTATGIKTYTCSTCGSYYTTSIDMIPHEYVDYTTADGVVTKCRICGQLKPN